jgi:catechol 2,3-dioxygenase-like lactoylglutathione lyase family enzyme
MEQGDLKLSKLSVIMLGVRDLKRSVAFYRDTLGLTPSGAVEAFSFFNAGGVTLALHGFPDLGTGDQRRTEIVFAVDDVDDAYQSLTARGVKFRIAPRLATGDEFVADFRDPDEHVLSIFGPRRRKAA